VSQHVLLVDDDEVLLEVLGTVLDLEAFTTTTASGGAEALAAVAARRPDAIVCDVAMPGVDGLEVCRRLKADPDTASIPLVLLTVRGGTADRAAGARAGCDAYLTKPFSPLRLIEVLRQVQVAAETRGRGCR
jgi:CheY-like chemotaxis protein